MSPWTTCCAEVDARRNRETIRTDLGESDDMLQVAYYFGRFLQLIGMSILLMAIVQAGPLGPNPRTFGAGVVAFIVGWLFVKSRTSR